MDMDLEKSGGNFLSIVFPFCEGNELFKHVSIGPPKKSLGNVFQVVKLQANKLIPTLSAGKVFLRVLFQALTCNQTCT